MQLMINITFPMICSNAPESLLCSYKKSFNGFVAMLTEEEKLRIAGNLTLRLAVVV